MQLPGRIPLRKSRLLDALILFAHLVAVSTVPILHLPHIAKWGFIGLIGVSLWLSLYRLRNLPVTALHLGMQGDLEIETEVGGRKTAMVEPGTAIFHWLIVLQLKCTDERIVLSLLPDSLDSDHGRQLRLWLRWRAATQLKTLA